VFRLISKKKKEKVQEKISERQTPDFLIKKDITQKKEKQEKKMKKDAEQVGWYLN
jgi:hypothetical protein